MSFVRHVGGVALINVFPGNWSSGCRVESTRERRLRLADESLIRAELANLSNEPPAVFRQNDTVRRIIEYLGGAVA
jgi:hypothetical protein